VCFHASAQRHRHGLLATPVSADGVPACWLLGLLGIKASVWLTSPHQLQRFQSAMGLLLAASGGLVWLGLNRAELCV